MTGTLELILADYRRSQSLLEAESGEFKVGIKTCTENFTCDSTGSLPKSRRFVRFMVSEFAPRNGSSDSQCDGRFFLL